jgi:hypothetical protein
LGYLGNGNRTALHLRVAIRAQQDALADLYAETLKAMSSPPCNSKLLEARIDVMELQRSQAAVVATEPAAAAGLLDEDLLRPTSPPHDGLVPAQPASEIASRFADMLGLSVAGADQRGVREPCGACLTGAGP